MKTWTSLAAGAAVLMSAGAVGAQDMVRIGTEGAYPPWNFTDSDGNLVGFEIDLAIAMCERMGVECEFVAQDWDGIIPALLNGRYDAIIAGMSITEERRESINFSQGYVTDPAFFVSSIDSDLQDAEAIDEVLAAVAGVVVGVQSATIHQNFLDQHTEADVRLYDTQELLAIDLAAGRIDAALADRAAWEPFLESDEGADFDIFGPGLNGAMFAVFGEGVGVGLRKEDTDLEAAFNAAICELVADGTTAALSEEWFGYDMSLPCAQ